MLILVLFKQIFSVIEGVTACKFATISTASFEPLAPLFSFDAEIERIELEVIAGLDKDNTFDAAA